MADMDTECLTEFLKDKGISIDDFKKMDPESEEYKKAYDGYEKFSEEWKQKNDSKGKPVVISEGKEASQPSNEKTEEQSENNPSPSDDWKKSIIDEWNNWAEKNGKSIKTFIDPEHTGNLAFHVYNSEADQKANKPAAEISYTSPREVSVKGPDGKVPAPEIFTQILKNAKTNGPDIEFGENMSPEFKANLMLACLKDPDINIVNPPSEEEIKSWPKDLQSAVLAAQAEKEAKKTNNTEQTNTENKSEEKKSPYQQALETIKTAKDNGDTKFDFSTLNTPEEKAIYTAAVMNVMGEDIKAGKFSLDNAPSYKEVAETTKTMSSEQQAEIKGGLTAYTIHSLKNIARGRGVAEYDPSKEKDKQAQNDWRAIDKNHTGLSAEQIALRKAREAKRDGK